ncbi:alpha/beta fold hydrolase [Candidatus Hodarchaeum mangrovi]
MIQSGRDDFSSSLHQNGEGRPLVLLHGFSGNSHQHWEQQLNNSNITSKYHVIAPNIFSFTTKTVKDIQKKKSPIYDLKNLRFLLKSHMKLKKPFIFVGYSIGGAIALTYASMFPQDVLGIILVSPLSVLNSFIPSIPKLPKSKRIVKKNSSFGKAAWIVFKRIIKAFSSVNLILNNERIIKFLKNFQKLNIPILLTYGLRDSINPSKNYDLLKQHLPPKTKIIPFEGDHSFHKSESEAFNKLLLSFCNDVERKLS